jgi:hypothetical protein
MSQRAPRRRIQGPTSNPRLPAITQSPCHRRRRASCRQAATPRSWDRDSIRRAIGLNGNPGPRPPNRALVCCPLSCWHTSRSHPVVRSLAPHSKAARSDSSSSSSVVVSVRPGAHTDSYLIGRASDASAAAANQVGSQTGSLWRTCCSRGVPPCMSHSHSGGSWRTLCKTL